MEHTCTALKPPGDCYRCDLNRDEVVDQVTDEVVEHLEAESPHRIVPSAEVREVIRTLEKIGYRLVSDG